MSKSTLNKVKLVVGMLYDYAIENGVVEQNYGKRLKNKTGRTCREGNIQRCGIKEN